MPAEEHPRIAVVTQPLPYLIVKTGGEIRRFERLPSCRALASEGGCRILLRRTHLISSLLRASIRWQLS